MIIAAAGLASAFNQGLIIKLRPYWFLAQALVQALSRKNNILASQGTTNCS